MRVRWPARPRVAPPNPARWALLFCAGLVAGLGQAQTAPDESRQPGPPGGRQVASSPDQVDLLLELHHTEREQVRLVLLPVVVTNRRGRIVTDLKVEDFQLFEDYAPQAIQYFGTDTSDRIAIVFLLDLSGSMRQVGKLGEAKEAIRTFVDALEPGDQFGLIGFADEQVTWITDFTADRERFLSRLEVQEAYGQTALFDAVAATPRLVDGQIEGRKAIVLITDGNDNASRLNTFKAVRLARSVNVPIYTIGFSSFLDRILPKGGREPNFRILARFSAETGGLLFPVNDPDDLKEAILQIQRELRFQYVLGYHPARNLWDGTFRRVKLETSRKGLVVRTRSGYYARP